MTFGKTMIKALKTFDIDSKHCPCNGCQSYTNWRHIGSINDSFSYLLRRVDTRYPISTRINRMETLFPYPPYLLFLMFVRAYCFLSHSSWNLCSNRSCSNYYDDDYYYYIIKRKIQFQLDPVYLVELTVFSFSIVYLLSCILLWYVP